MQKIKVINSKKIIIVLAALVLFITVCQSGETKSVAVQEFGDRSKAMKPKHEGNVSSQYHFDVWTTDTGLPQNSVISILQTRDGYLWLTTLDGLVRYDGVHFTIFNAGNTKGLKSSRFSRLFEDRDGNLWIMTEAFGLIRYRDGLFTTITKEDGLSNDRVLNFTDDGEGVLFATPDGVTSWKDGKFEVHDASPGRAYAGFGFPVRSGVSWHLDPTGLHRVENGRVTTDAPVIGLTTRDIKSVCESRNGDLWLGVTDGILMRFRDGRFTYYSQKDGLTGERINCISEDRQGNLWLGLANSGLFRFRDNRFTQYTRADGLTGNDINSIYGSREGILWIGNDLRPEPVAG
jgi:ligand-binding sensor domain-containing protein